MVAGPGQPVQVSTWKGARVNFQSTRCGNAENVVPIALESGAYNGGVAGVVERVATSSMVALGLEASGGLARWPQAPGSRNDRGQHWGQMGRRSNHAVQPTACAVSTNKDRTVVLAPAGG